MNTINFPETFDQFILVPGFDRKQLREWFRDNGNARGVYTIFDRQFKPLYVGSSIDLRRRLRNHHTKGQRKLEGHFDDVLFIGLKYIESGDTTPKERQFIRELDPLLNTYKYRV